ncbi:MAG TPA: hypothetical protein VER55_12055 [Ardenticatenaceae bacterium]|nr:hypothetical protein [Ardenticatenaceae bacterium]
MLISRGLTIRAFVGLALALVLAVAARGFAASNTLSSSAAGDGRAAVSGYTISSVVYTLDDVDPRIVSQVRFTVTPPSGAAAPRTVRAKLISTSSSYVACSLVSGSTWQCTLSVAAVSADELRIIASQ